jgi:hypothetical protein
MKDVRKAVEKAVAGAAVADIHTHLYAPCFGEQLLWGIDDLLTYHYLVAETFRWLDIPYARFWSLSKREQADLVWKTLFVDRSPLSEATRGVVTVLHTLGLDARKRDLGAARRFFAAQKPAKYIDRVFELSGVREVVMTNDPFDERERTVWLGGYKEDSRFKGALRIDPILLGWERACGRLRELGYSVEASLSARSVQGVKHFLCDWAERTGALYVGVSLPPTFAFPDGSLQTRLLEQCLLPAFADLNLPFAMMIGVKRQTNPELGLAGDSVGRASIEPVEQLCALYPKNKFMVTMLARENQHELCVAARKFRNLLVFGCWWFVNNPVIIEEMTRMRLEMLGPSMIPQHSDARVLDQLLYKWDHSKRIIGDVLAEKYEDLASRGWAVDEKEIRRDVASLFGGTFKEFLARQL